MTTGRNERCPCGSGKKYKQCCESNHRAGSVSGSTLLLGTLVALVLAGGLAAMWRNSSGETFEQGGPSGRVEAATTPAAQLPATGEGAASGPPFPEPPGPAPKGQVWSPEHGHYHQQSSVQIEASDSRFTASAGNTPPQPGAEAPPGMVWSEAHGHYHPISAGPGDAPETSVPRSQIPRVSVRPDGTMVQNAPQGGPTGVAPEGMVWSEEHGHWHQAEPAPPSPSGNPQQRR
jgi:hypothetical protein